jgi:hypothetical protein
MVDSLAYKGYNIKGVEIFGKGYDPGKAYEENRERRSYQQGSLSVPLNRSYKVVPINSRSYRVVLYTNGSFITQYFYKTEKGAINKGERYVKEGK